MVPEVRENERSVMPQKPLEDSVSRRERPNESNAGELLSKIRRPLDLVITMTQCSYNTFWNTFMNTGMSVFSYMSHWEVLWSLLSFFS